MAMRTLHGDIAFLGYQDTRLPEKCRMEQMEYLKKMAEELMELRRSGHLPTMQHGVPEDENDDKMADSHDDPPEPDGAQVSTHG